MRRHNLNYVIVGLFVSAMLAAAIVAIALLTGQTGATDRYFVVLANVADLKFGTQVRYEGYPIGQVERIEPFPEGGSMRFRIAMAVREGWRIPVDSLARIGSSSFLAAKTIDIQSGTRDEVIAVGGEVPGAPPTDVFAVVAKVASEFSDIGRTHVTPLLEQTQAAVARAGELLDQDVAELLDSLNGIADAMEVRVPRLAESVEKDVGDLLGTLNRVAETLEGRVPDLADSLGSLMARLDASAESLQEVLSDDNVEAIRRVVENVETTSAGFSAMSADLRGTARRVDGVIGRIDDLVADNRGNVDKSIRDLQYTLRSIAQNIDSINQNLEGTTRNMKEFSRLIRQNPGLLLGGTSRAPEPLPAAESEAALPR